MKRVYTDKRFPGVEIVNHGSGTFQVLERGQLLTDFESWENQDGTVSEPFAARRAHDYFERWSRQDLSGEIAAQNEEPVSAEHMNAVDHTEVFNAPAKPISRQIDQLMARERMEPDPNRKGVLQRQIMQLMRREESMAEAVVNHLIR